MRLLCHLLPQTPQTWTSSQTFEKFLQIAIQPEQVDTASKAFCTARSFNKLAVDLYTDGIGVALDLIRKLAGVK